jgi:ATP-binding cassette subfamily F protein uup
VSHDRYFLDRICDQIIAFEEDGVIVQPGNYSYYLEKRQAREAADRALAKAYKITGRASSVAEIAAKPRKLTLAERKELEGIEAAILAAEEAVSAIEASLNDPEVHATRFAEIPELVKALDSAKARVTELYARWETLESLA